MMRAWYFPSPSGDYRLEASGDECVFTVIDPTESERRIIGHALNAWREQSFVDEAAGVADTGETRFIVRAPIQRAGAILAASAILASDRDAWTAMRSTGGRITVENASPTPPPPATESAATMQVPYRGCPAPSPAARRASEVLYTFCTPRQRSTFERFGYLDVDGHLSGRRFRIFHRDEAAARGMRHIALDLEMANTRRRMHAEVCAWNEDVPAEEEVLGVKLALEHRERWFSSGRVGLNELAPPRQVRVPGRIRRAAARSDAP